MNNADAESMTERELLAKLASVLAPIDSLIDHSLYVGTVEQMRADLSYLRGLTGAAHSVITDALNEQHRAAAREVVA